MTRGRGRQGPAVWVVAASLVTVQTLSGGACRVQRDRVDASGALVGEAVAPGPRSESAPSSSPIAARPPPAVSQPAVALVAGANALDPTEDAGATGVPTDADESLQAEDRERDPRSDTVTIKLLVEPPKRAHAFWGMKDLGVTPLEIRRPRGSGPLDLAIKAPGYLTIHTRAFTDRDDRVTIRLVPDAEAPRTFGYRAPVER